MKDNSLAKCGASVRVNGVRQQCGLIPAEHGIERDRIGIKVGHPFVLTGR